MSSNVYGSRVRRFLIALTLYTVGPMTLPGGPFDASHLQALSHEIARLKAIAILLW